MTIDVNKPSSNDYLTKPTSQVPTPPCRDHQHNKNQTIPTITIQDQAFDSNTSDQDDFYAKTLEEQMQQYNEECYGYFDDIDDDDKVIEIPHDMFDCDPTTEHMPTMIEEEYNPPIDNISIDAATTIEEAEEEQQQTRHRQSNDWPVSIISNNNTNNNNKNKKKKQKKATLKMTHMPAIIEEEPNSPTTNNWIDDLTPSQKKALTSADITFIEQTKIEIQQQEQERQK